MFFHEGELGFLFLFIGALDWIVIHWLKLPRDKFIILSSRSRRCTIIMHIYVNAQVTLLRQITRLFFRESRQAVHLHSRDYIRALY